MTFSGSLRGLVCTGLACVALAALSVLAGCASPVSEGSGAINTGTYPNLNVQPAVAGTQFTPYSLAQHNARLAAAQQNQAGETAVAAATLDQSAADAARLRQLRGTHGESTLNNIESGTATAPAPAAN